MGKIMSKYFPKKLKLIYLSILDATCQLGMDKKYKLATTLEVILLRLAQSNFQIVNIHNWGNISTSYRS